MTRWVGDRDLLGLEFELRRDPDAAGASDLRVSWGAVAIWVAGRNITRGVAADGIAHDHAEVPLLPIARWLVASWDFLLHEERLPRPPQSLSAAAWRTDSLLRLPVDPDALDRYLDEREAWWERHGLGAALPDYRIPDLHLRRCGDDVEVSWDDREWRSVPGGVQLVEQPGVAHLPVQSVAETLQAFVNALLEALTGHVEAGAACEELREEVAALMAPERQRRRLELAAGLDLGAMARRLRSLAGVRDGTVEETVQALLGLPPAVWRLGSALWGDEGNEDVVRGQLGLKGITADRPWVEALPVPVLLYRSAAPSLSFGDLTQLLTIARKAANESAEGLLEYRRPSRAAGTPQGITEDGLERAIALRESLGVPLDLPLTGQHDLERVLLRRLNVLVLDVHLDDTGVDGAAIMQPGGRAIIAVNRSGRFARTPWGRRMTLAHELCHLLHDGRDDGAVGLVSNPWAPYAVERRANAFAAMLLMPQAAVARCLSPDPESWAREDLRRAMQTLGVGVSTLTWHLFNLEWITHSDRLAWLDELSQP